MLLAVVPDAIERSDEIVRDQQRTIRQLRHIDGATQVIAIVVPPLGKRLGLSCDVAGARGEHQTEVCRMSGLFNLRENHVGGRGIVLVFSGTRTTAAIPRKAEILTG